MPPCKRGGFLYWGFVGKIEGGDGMALKVTKRGNKVLLFVLGIVLVLAVIVKLSLLSFVNAGWILSALSIGMGVFIMVEVGVKKFFNRSTYKSLTGSDVLGLMSGVFAGMLIADGVFSLVGFATVLSNVSAVVFGIGAVLAFVYAVWF